MQWQRVTAHDDVTEIPVFLAFALLNFFKNCSLLFFLYLPILLDCLLSILCDKPDGLEALLFTECIKKLNRFEIALNVAKRLKVWTKMARAQKVCVDVLLM